LAKRSQSQRYSPILPKSLAAPPTPTPDGKTVQQKMNNDEMKNNETLTCGHKTLPVRWLLKVFVLLPKH
jgi:hypothetical protein